MLEHKVTVLPYAACLAAIDGDNDGEVSFNEYIAWLIRIGSVVLSSEEGKADTSNKPSSGDLEKPSGESRTVYTDPKTRRAFSRNDTSGSSRWLGAGESGEEASRTVYTDPKTRRAFSRNDTSGSSRWL